MANQPLTKPKQERTRGGAIPWETALEIKANGEWEDYRSNSSRPNESDTSQPTENLSEYTKVESSLVLLGKLEFNSQSDTAAVVPDSFQKPFENTPTSTLDTDQPRVETTNTTASAPSEQVVNILKDFVPNVDVSKLGLAVVKEGKDMGEAIKGLSEAIMVKAESKPKPSLQAGQQKKAQENSLVQSLRNKLEDTKNRVPMERARQLLNEALRISGGTIGSLQEVIQENLMNPNLSVASIGIRHVIEAWNSRIIKKNAAKTQATAPIASPVTKGFQIGKGGLLKAQGEQKFGNSLSSVG